MSLDLAAVDAALIDALPILAGTAFPALLCIAGVAIAEWHRLGQDDDTYSVADYYPVAVGRAPVPGPVDAHTEPVGLAAWNAATPVYAELAARPMPEIVAHRIAHTWLDEIGQHARAGATA